jgi:hypothetical protein
LRGWDLEFEKGFVPRFHQQWLPRGCCRLLQSKLI